MSYWNNRAAMADLLMMSQILYSQAMALHYVYSLRFSSAY